MAAATVKNSFLDEMLKIRLRYQEKYDLKSMFPTIIPQWHVKEYATWKDAKEALFIMESRLIMDSGKLEQYSDDKTA